MSDGEWQPESDPSKECSVCSGDFQYSRIDNQINDSWYIYCSDCGSTGLLNSSDALPQAVLKKCGYELAAEAEPFLPACNCGGAYRHGALPRCPHCNAEIGRDEIIAMLNYYYEKEEWSAATSKAGCLQNCVIINERIQRLFS